MTALRTECRGHLDVSAASGLVFAGGLLHVIADDELALARYHLDARPAGRLRLLAGELPAAHAARKREKPDFEALALLPGGALLALGSGSRENRMRGVLVLAGDAVRPVDLAPLYAAVAAELPPGELNIEGAAVVGERLYLLQRGNGPSRVNALIEVALPAAGVTTASMATLGADLLRDVRRVALGTLGGVPLSFTDATPHPDGGLLFAAAAEASANTYDDGACAGSIVGRLTVDGTPSGIIPLDGRHKIEGLTIGPAGELFLVADADDRSVPAPLYVASLP